MHKLGSEVTEDVSGNADKEVTCESCHQVYRYRIEREGAGEGSVGSF